MWLFLARKDRMLSVTMKSENILGFQVYCFQRPYSNAEKSVGNGGVLVRTSRKEKSPFSLAHGKTIAQGSINFKNGGVILNSWCSKSKVWNLEKKSSLSLVQSSHHTDCQF